MDMTRKSALWLILPLLMLVGTGTALAAGKNTTAKKDGAEYYTPETTIMSAPLDVQTGPATPAFGSPPSFGSAPSPSAGSSAMFGSIQGGGLLQLARPVAVAAWNEFVYIADEGHQAILRYDRMRDRFSIFYKMRVSPELRMTATISGTLYITDVPNSQVLQVDNTGFAGQGVLVRTFRDFNLQKPMAVAEDNIRGRILVVDGMQNQILAFDRLGRLGQVMQPMDNRGLPLHGLRDLVVGPDGLYLLDGVLRKVVITDLDGRFITSFGSKVLQQPSAIALDSEKRVVVADAFSSQLQIFVLGAKSAVVQSARETVSVMQLSDLAVVEDNLYLADAGGSRVMIMRVQRVPIAKATK